MTADEAEAQRMAQEMSFMCSPPRHRALADSRSMIRREAGDLAGTAGLVRTAEGTFLVLEGYDDNQAGHCLVLAWFGGELHAGTYAIRQLTMAAVEEEVGADEHSFFVFSAVRSPEESSMLVTSSGSLVIEEMAAGSLTGTFELTGFGIESGARSDGVELHGSFSALEYDG